MERGKGDCKRCLGQIGRAQNRFNKHGQMKIRISDPPSSLSARLMVVNRSVSPTGRGPRTPETRSSCTLQVIQEAVWLVVCTRSQDSSAGGGGVAPIVCETMLMTQIEPVNPRILHLTSHLSSAVCPLLPRFLCLRGRRGFPSSAEIHTFIDFVS